MGSGCHSMRFDLGRLINKFNKKFERGYRLRRWLDSR